LLVSSHVINLVEQVVFENDRLLHLDAVLFNFLG